MQRSDARKRKAAPSNTGALTEAEWEAVNAAACGNCGERTAVLNLVARIKTEAVQAERERIAQEVERMTLRGPDNHLKHATAVRAVAAHIARGEGR